MKLAAYVLGALLLIAAVVYFTVPADSLPPFLPGHESGLARVRMKHGLVAGIVGLVLLGAGWFIGNRASAR